MALENRQNMWVNIEYAKACWAVASLVLTEICCRAIRHPQCAVLAPCLVMVHTQPPTTRIGNKPLASLCPLRHSKITLTQARKGKKIAFPDNNYTLLLVLLTYLDVSNYFIPRFLKKCAL